MPFEVGGPGTDTIIEVAEALAAGAKSVVRAGGGVATVEDGGIVTRFPDGHTSTHGTLSEALNEATRYRASQERAAAAIAKYGGNSGATGQARAAPAQQSQTAATVPLKAGQPAASDSQAAQAMGQGIGETAASFLNGVNDFTAQNGQIVGVVITLLAIFWLLQKGF